MTVTDSELTARAKKVAKLHKASEEVLIGEVGCALSTSKGKTYVGASIQAPCGIGFCAEHSAIASMVTNGEHRIRKIVAVSGSGAIMPPCGRCRELMYQIDKRNLDAEIIIGKGKSARLRDLLPNPW